MSDGEDLYSHGMVEILFQALMYAPCRYLMSMQHKRKFPIAVANVSAVMEGKPLQTCNFQDTPGLPMVA